MQFVTGIAIAVIAAITLAPSVNAYMTVTHYPNGSSTFLIKNDSDLSLDNPHVKVNILFLGMAVFTACDGILANNIRTDINIYDACSHLFPKLIGDPILVEHIHSILVHNSVYAHELLTTANNNFTNFNRTNSSGGQ
jgi:hypothetical protein